MLQVWIMVGLRIFIGSSKERLGTVRTVARWIAEAGHTPVPWNEPGLFRPGDTILAALHALSRNVDGAILIFGSDDRVWYREDAVAQPRDNVLIEYGLFAAALGVTRTVICRVSGAKLASDLQGIVYADLASPKTARAAVDKWLIALDVHVVPCAGEKNSRSIGSPDPADITVENKTRESLVVYWLDFEGRRQEWFRLPPSARQTDSTWNTHAFVITDTAGRCLRLFRAPADVAVDSV